MVDDIELEGPVDGDLAQLDRRELPTPGRHAPADRQQVNPHQEECAAGSGETSQSFSSW